VFISEALTITTANLIEVSFSLVEFTETGGTISETLAGFSEINSRPHKQSTGDPSSNSERAKEPAEAIFTVGGDKCKVQSGSNGDLELADSHDDRLHAFWRLREGVLERGDGRKDFPDADENIRTRDDPDVDGGGERVAVGVRTFRGQVVVTWAHLVDVVLENARVDHRGTNDHEAHRNALDGAEVDAPAAQEGIDDVVEDGDEDYDRDGVQILDQVVWSAIECHSSSHGTIVPIYLRVAEPENREPQEDLARRDGTGYFADELIVPGEVFLEGPHPCKMLVGAGINHTVSEGV
jgi:hypothetical protein